MARQNSPILSDCSELQRIGEGQSEKLLSCKSRGEGGRTVGAGQLEVNRPGQNLPGTGQPTANSTKAIEPKDSRVDITITAEASSVSEWSWEDKM